jgi:hypothetical protein
MPNVAPAPDRSRAFTRLDGRQELDCEGALDSFRGAEDSARCVAADAEEGGSMSLWLLILIILLVVLLLGGFGYSRRV